MRSGKGAIESVYFRPSPFLALRDISLGGALNLLFNNRAAIGGFNVTGSGPAGWYWSFSRYLNYNAWAQRFSDGYQFHNFRYNNSSLRLVR